MSFRGGSRMSWGRYPARRQGDGYRGGMNRRYPGGSA